MNSFLRISVLSLFALVCTTASAQQAGVVEHEEKSAYSKIRVIKEKNVRSLCFVRDSGEVIIESMVDIEKPHELLVPYTRLMFTSYRLKPKQEKVLIVGLGGGSMIHFLTHYDPQVKADVQSQEDIKNIRDSFGQTYVFRMPNLAGFVVVGSMEAKRTEIAALRTTGDELDRRFKTSYSFRDMVDRLAPP